MSSMVADVACIGVTVRVSLRIDAGCGRGQQSTKARAWVILSRFLSRLLD